MSFHSKALLGFSYSDDQANIHGNLFKREKLGATESWIREYSSTVLTSSEDLKKLLPLMWVLNYGNWNDGVNIDDKSTL